VGSGKWVEGVGEKEENEWGRGGKRGEGDEGGGSTTHMKLRKMGDFLPPSLTFSPSFSLLLSLLLPVLPHHTYHALMYI
jgi:hypothetical protein